MNSVATSVNRYVDLNNVIQYIVDSGLTLDEFKIDGDYIRIGVSGEHRLDMGLFEEFLSDLEMEYDMEHFGV